MHDSITIIRSGYLDAIASYSTHSRLSGREPRSRSRGVILVYFIRAIRANRPLIFFGFFFFVKAKETSDATI